MYLRELQVKNLKLLRDFPLSFLRADGSERMWTVIIGRNGTGKTSLLYAIAMAAAGSSQVSTLAKPVIGHLRDRRGNEAMDITATFGFPDLAHDRLDLFPGLTHFPKPSSDLCLRSKVTLHPGETNLEASSTFTRMLKTREAEAQFEVWGNNGNPLDKARSRNLKFWFVAGYGISRMLPDPAFKPPLTQPSTERLSPLFDYKVALTSIGFANYYADQPDKARMFSRVLKKVLFHPKIRLLPDLVGLELRGYGGVRKAGDLLERERFKQKIGKEEYNVPAVALAHGYQSTIAWIADLVGHIVLEADAEIKPEDMTGLVLLDEIDLYLHPTWQVSLVGALRDIFPKLQFVVTTHSPLVLASVPPEDVVMLVRDEQSGDVKRANWTMREDADARVMTTADLYQRYFDMPDIFPTPEGRALRDFLTSAGDPHRTAAEDKRLKEAAKELVAAGIDPEYPVVPREAAPPRER